MSFEEWFNNESKYLTWITTSFNSKIKESLSQAYEAGYKDGYKDGYYDGESKGIQEAPKVMEEIKNV